MDRAAAWQQLEAQKRFDVVVIGGGAVGLGTALDALSRGYSCALLEQYDFAKGTSSKSTKLIHGGVRYLAQGNVSLVREALAEREWLLQHAATLVRPLRFLIPCYSSWERWYYWTGMKCYDTLAGRLGIRSSHVLSTAEVEDALPGLHVDGLAGAVAYHDAQFDDAGLVLSLARRCAQLGGTVLNYAVVTELLKQGGKLDGVVVRDQETQQEYQVRAGAVVNATGAGSDAVRRLDDAEAETLIAPSQGIHLVVDTDMLGGDDALMIPKTKDGRVLFAIPWLGRLVLGTTDTPVPDVSWEPRPQEEEIDYLLTHFADYLQQPLSRSDVRSTFAGLRPLVKPPQQATATSKISREHAVLTADSGLVSIVGGKWTTYRKMAEDVVDVLQRVADLPKRKSTTREMTLEARSEDSTSPLAEPTPAQITAWAQEGFARTLEDVLARRSRLLLLDARASCEMAPRVVQHLAAALKRDKAWETEQLSEFNQLASRYLPESAPKTLSR